MTRPLIAIFTLLTLCVDVAFGETSAAKLDSCRTAAEAIRMFDNRHLSPIEGVWELTDSGATVAIIANSQSQRHVTSEYCIVYVSGPDLRIPRGSIIGRATQGSSANLYDAAIFSEVSIDAEGSPALSSTRDYVMTVTADDRLSLHHYHKGLKVNAWRLIPYMLRYSVRKVDQRPANLDGMVRIYPQSAKQPICL